MNLTRLGERSTLTIEMLDAIAPTLERARSLLSSGRSLLVRDLLTLVFNAAIVGAPQLLEPEPELEASEPESKPSPSVEPSAVAVAVAWCAAFLERPVPVRDVARLPSSHPLVGLLLPVAASPSNPIALSARRVNAYLDRLAGRPIELGDTVVRFVDVTVTGARVWRLAPIAPVVEPDGSPVDPAVLVERLLAAAAARGGPAEVAEERAFLDAVRAGDVRPETEPYLSLYRTAVDDPLLP